ncbi:MAG TPA: response regulator, partial [Burkholderiales bacterium]|nr:response regulator [Burkholderiales bacterium]
GIRREYEGLGIGLALVKKITELHHGTISVASAGNGRGTEVVVRFPLAAAPLDTGTVADTANTAPVPLAGVSLLVVDDVDDARETLRILLQQVGARVAVASGGREALDMVRHSLPDLVLCDLRMPEMDGFAFIRELHGPGPAMHLPVVAVSALTSAADRQRTREAGFHGHIDKPFDEATIVAAVDAALHARLDSGAAAMAGVGAGG